MFPKVSVIIPTHNRYTLLRRAIRSVIDQDYASLKDSNDGKENTRIEIIVVDDCSTQEEYKNIPYDMTQLSPPPLSNIEIKFLKTPYPTGCPAAPRNLGLSVATGDYICFLDDDDYFLPNKISTQLEAMCSCGAEISCSEALVKKEDNEELYYADKYNDFVRGKGYNQVPYSIRTTMMMDHNWVIASSVMITKELVKRVGLFIKGSLNKTGWEDWDYWQRCSVETEKKGCCILYMDKPLVYYNIVVTDKKWHFKDTN